MVSATVLTALTPIGVEQYLPGRKLQNEKLVITLDMTSAQEANLEEVLELRVLAGPVLETYAVSYPVLVKGHQTDHEPEPGKLILTVASQKTGYRAKLEIAEAL